MTEETKATDTVTVKADELIERLEGYRDAYAKAQEEISNRWEAELYRLTADLVSASRDDCATILKRMKIVHEDKPIDHTDFYDEMSEFLYASVDTEVTLTRDEFNAYWRNQPSWMKYHEERAERANRNEYPKTAPTSPF